GGNIQRMETKGPYLNFFIKKRSLSETAIADVLKKRSKYGIAESNEEKPIVIEYSGPNTNKPMHLGHIRNNLLGITVARILEWQGDKVIKLNWINDRGIHICKSMLAYMKWGDNAKPEIKPDHFVGGFYVLFNEKLKENPGLDEEAQELLRRWESGEKEIRALWKKMNEWAYEGFNQTYEVLGCSFDKWYYESEIYHEAKRIIEDGMRKGIFFRDGDGVIVARLEPYGMPNKILLRADGTSIYSTSDIALALEKAKLNFSKSLYVVGSEQILYLKQMFKIFELLGYPWSKDLYHLSYGMVFLPEGKMKSREGKVVDADDIVAEMKDFARKEVRRRYPDLLEKEIGKRAEAIGLGALKFFMLKTDADRDIYYNPEESISFEGETGPYVQYAHARICSILERSKKKPRKADLSLLKHEREITIVKLLSQFPVACASAAKNYKPHIITRYLLDLAQAFNEFYHSCQILKEKKDLRDARLMLITAVRIVLENGLNLLGIVALEKM
ncbi:arginine--tRNA ligase, partial [Candidatus Woesearchaeota archaeon]|nr:arginine--tRNA ligase [Candidatus Woesearchaeota archaeon]